MNKRKGERIGWVGGWLGGFVWVLILSAELVVRGETLPAIIGLLICAAGSSAIVFLAPWRHPRTSYRLLLIPIYVLFFCSVGWGVWALGGPRQMGINGWWSLLLLMPILMPLWIVGDRRWEDGETQQTNGTEDASGDR